jgi:2-dehydro-3-deoxyphosphogluconate aldolase/(4S)-4-hydroxy-2-oxoglutarate aldolase
MLTALAAPFPEVRFVPTGGIRPAQLAGYLADPRVLAVGGTWMVAPKLVAAGDWDQISRLTAEAVALAGNGSEG